MVYWSIQFSGGFRSRLLGRCSFPRFLRDLLQDTGAIAYGSNLQPEGLNIIPHVECCLSSKAHLLDLGSLENGCADSWVDHIVRSQGRLSSIWILNNVLTCNLARSGRPRPSWSFLNTVYYFGLRHTFGLFVRIFECLYQGADFAQSFGECSLL